MRSFRLQDGEAVEPQQWSALAPGGSVTSFGQDARRRALHPDRGGTGIPDRAQVAESLGALAARLPAHVRFGASSWNYPGWRGLVYHREYQGRGASARMLEEYAAFPLFRTVGIDSSFYAPPTEEALGSYAEHLPPGFPCVSKVWNQITVHTFSKAQDKARAGQINPDFLEPRPVPGSGLRALPTRLFADHAGPFVFEFQTIGRADRRDARALRRPARRVLRRPARARAATRSRSGTRSS